MVEDGRKLLAVAMLFVLGQLEAGQFGNVFNFLVGKRHGRDYNAWQQRAARFIMSIMIEAS